MLPACLLAIRFPEASACWLVFISLVTRLGGWNHADTAAFEFASQFFKRMRPPDESLGWFIGGLIGSQAVAFIRPFWEDALFFLSAGR